MSRRSWRWIGPACFVVAGTAAQLLNQAGQRTTDTVWAEDGQIYASQAYARPAVKTLFLGYAGYAQLLPRVLALGARAVPVSEFALYAAVVSAVTWALLGLFVHRSTKGWIDSPWLRWLLAAFVVASPIVALEVNATITNVGWGLVVAAFWAVVSQQRSWPDVALRCAVVALAALGTPLAAVVLPMAVVMIVRRRSVADVWVLGSLVVSLVVQAIAVRSTVPLPGGGGWTASDVVTEYGVRALAATIIGERWLETIWLTLGYALVGLAVVALMALVLLSRPARVPADRRLLVVGAAATSLITTLFTVQVRGSRGLRITTNHFEIGGARYYIIPVLLLISAVFVLADSSRRAWLIALVFVWGSALLVLHFAQPNGRSHGPSWAQGVDAAAIECRSPSAPRTVNIPVSPKGWFVVVPCDRLLS